jgi:hypothetical protein
VGSVLDGNVVSVGLVVVDVVAGGFVVVVSVLLGAVSVEDVKLGCFDCSVFDAVAVSVGLAVVCGGEVVVVPVDVGDGFSVVVSGAGGVPAAV